MMQQDEACLLRPWLAWHGQLFGLDNLFVFDNGSTRPDVLASLDGFARRGVRIDRRHASREAYLAKGRLTTALLRELDATGDYDILIPLDCDEFVALRTEADVCCDRDAILEHLASLTGERRTLRFPWQLANHPVLPDLYHHFAFFKVFFAAGTVLAVDHGNHLTEGAPRDIVETRLIHLHFHHRMFALKQAQARRTWTGIIDVDDRSGLADYFGPSAHLNRFFLEDRDAYYASLLGKVHFQLSHVAALMRDLGEPLALPSEPLPPRHQIRVVARDPAADDPRNGTVVLVPTGDAAARGDNPAEFRLTRFHEGHYLRANPGLAAAKVDPTVHFCHHGWRENRLLGSADPPE